VSRPSVLLGLFLAVAHLALSLTCLVGGMALSGGSGAERPVSELASLLGETLLLMFRGLTFPALLLARSGVGTMARGALEWPMMAVNALFYGTVGALLLRKSFQEWLDSAGERPRSE
jgi:hypothetical protein